MTGPSLLQNQHAMLVPSRQHMFDATLVDDQDVSRIWGETQVGLSENGDALYLKRKMMIHSQIMGKQGKPT